VVEFVDPQPPDWKKKKRPLPGQRRASVALTFGGLWDPDLICCQDHTLCRGIMTSITNRPSCKTLIKEVKTYNLKRLNVSTSNTHLCKVTNHQSAAGARGRPPGERGGATARCSAIVPSPKHINYLSRSERSMCNVFTFLGQFVCLFVCLSVNKIIGLLENL